MSTVRKILEVKGKDVWTVSPEASVFDALRIMASKGVGALLVMKNETLAGIISERDYARKIILDGKASRSTPVSEIMTREVITVHPEQTAQECMTIMDKHSFRHLPVVENGMVVGMISQRDVLRILLHEQREIVKDMEGRISGGRSL